MKRNQNRFEKKSKNPKAPKQLPLEKQIQEDQELVNKTRNKKRKQNDENSAVVEKDLSSKILARAREQLNEDEEQEEREDKRDKKVTFSKIQNFSEEDEEDRFSDVDETEYNPEEWEEQINEEDEEAMEMFMSREGGQRVTLADIIMDKLNEKQETMGSTSNDLNDKLASKLDPKIVEVYTKIGQLLTRYTSGKLPKAFKVIPSLSNWEELVYLTQPETWSAQATRQATRLFASNLNSRMAQRFFSLILLPKIREDVRTNKKLNFHFYFSLKKALYKPAAFYKGILLPLCESRDCTLREATIIASILSRMSVPILHSSAAILKISEMEYSGASSIFLRVLLNKKYALPYRVVDAVVNHFQNFLNEDRNLPLLWHQSLLIFVQRYKTDLFSDQKDIIRSLVKKHNHYYFREEILRELANSKHRGEDVSADQKLEMDMD